MLASPNNETREPESVRPGEAFSHHGIPSNHARSRGGQTATRQSSGTSREIPLPAHLGLNFEARTDEKSAKDRAEKSAKEGD